MQLDADPSRWSMRLVARGDLQATFAFHGFEEVRRLGLRRGTEAAVRAAAPDGENHCLRRVIYSAMQHARRHRLETPAAIAFSSLQAGHNGLLRIADVANWHGVQAEQLHATVLSLSAVSAAGAEGDLNTGMLTVDSVVPGGVADGFLQPGDVLVRLASHRP